MTFAFITGAGCTVLPEVVHEPQIHNPFPQLHRIAVLPFFNQSGYAFINQEEIAQAYFVELQQIPGFEVMPIGVAANKVRAMQTDLSEVTDFQEIARKLNVDVVVVGSVTEFSPYYPPKMGLAVNWYAANPGFHPIPPGYGLPWNTPYEEFIPDRLVLESQFAVAREQMKLLTPQEGPVGSGLESPQSPELHLPAEAPGEAAIESHSESPSQEASSNLPGHIGQTGAMDSAITGPRRFQSPAMTSPTYDGVHDTRPPYWPQYEPIMTHTRLFDGRDARFTDNLATYFRLQNDTRMGGWQAYLQRSDDFIRFCCYLHIAEMLTARGGADKTRVALRPHNSR